jgi:hypothetical protein
VLLNGDIPLNKALLRVGFHFGLSTGDRMFGGRVGKKVAWERPKWRLSYLLPFFDERCDARPVLLNRVQPVPRTRRTPHKSWRCPSFKGNSASPARACHSVTHKTAAALSSC